MPRFNLGLALQAGYKPEEVLRYLAAKGVDPQYEGTDEDIIRQHLAASGGKVMLPYSYGPSDAPPPAAPAPLPAELSGAPQTFGRNPRTGEPMQGGYVPFLDDPLEGATQFAGGYEGLQRAETGGQRAGALSEMVRGGMRAASPLLPSALAGAPVNTLAALGTGSLMGSGTEQYLTNQGVDPGYAALGGDIAGFATGSLAAGAPWQTLPDLLRAPRAIGQRGAVRWDWRPGTKLADIPESVDIPRADPKKLLVEDVARYLNTQAQKRLGTIPASASEKQKLQRLLRLGRTELEDQLTKPREETGVDWYSLDTKRADAGLASVFPELKSDPVRRVLQKSISAVMSNNSNPREEAFNGARIYKGFRGDGRIPMVQPESGKEWPAQGAGIQLLKIQDMIDVLGEQGFADFIMNPQKVVDIRRFRPGAEGKAGDMVPGSLVLGPKVGRYFMDLMGMPQDGSTIDVWDMRGQGRRLGRLFDPNGRMIEVPTPESERPIFMQQHKVLGDEFGLTRNQTQSGLWHYEQDLYRRLGLPVKSYKRSEGVAKFLGR